MNSIYGFQKNKKKSLHSKKLIQIKQNEGEGIDTEDKNSDIRKQLNLINESKNYWAYLSK